MQSENNRNMIIAIVLSVVVLFGWQFFVSGPQLQQGHRAQSQRHGERGRGVVTSCLVAVFFNRDLICLR